MFFHFTNSDMSFNIFHVGYNKYRVDIVDNQGHIEKLLKQLCEMQNELEKIKDEKDERVR